MFTAIKKSFLSFFNYNTIDFYKNGLILFISYIVSALTSLLVTYALSKYLSTHAFGEYRYIVSTMSIITGLSMSGLGQNLTTIIAGGKIPNIKYFFTYQLKWSLVGSLVGTVLSLYYFINNNSTLAVSILVLSILAPFINATQIINSYLNGQNKYKKIAGIQNGVNIVTTIALLASLLIANKSVIVIIFVFYFSYLTTYTYFFLKEVKNYKQTQEIDVVFFHKKNLTNSLNNFISQINLVFDKVFAFTMIGGTALAFYSFSTLFVDQFRSIIKIGSTISITKLVNSSIEKNQLFKSQLVKIIITCLLFIVGYFLLGPLIFKLFFNNYYDSFKYSLVIAFTIIPLSIISYIQNILQANLDTKKMISLNLIQLAVNSLSFTPVLWYKNFDSLVMAKVVASFLSLFIVVAYKKLFFTKPNH